ncbi:hypothetical protein H5410_060811 [Solanum commersonii]|uniref:CCHC-type domain-containing protein n=1 Tax=Solanum commersonii TaxID=4109 RepID=A0A9J5W626_SOLCO|nr:hypothetical protein H5410_060811 [Solanum commersonii]
MRILGEQITSIHDNVDKLLSRINSNTKGKEKVANTSIQPPPEIENFKLKDFSDLESLLERKFKGCSLKPLGVDDFSGGESNYKKEFSDEINKISEKHARKPVQRMYNYPRPTPQDVLLEEHEHIITNNYNEKKIYEWNIDGYTDRQIYTTVHRMFMYNTICKANKNSDKTIVNMITTGFTGQLKGWWNNYLNTEQSDKILQAVKQEGEHNLTQNAVCKTLTSFRFYKDVVLSRVMELPEYGLQALFAERVRKTLRGDSHSINYDNYTYGKLIFLKKLPKIRSILLRTDLPKRIIKHGRKEEWKRKKEELNHIGKKRRSNKQKFSKSDTCHKCDRFGHYARDCRVKEKIKCLDIDNNIKDSLCKILLNSNSGKSETEYNSSEESSTSEDLKALHQEDCMSSDDCLPCQQGINCGNEGEEYDLYTIYSQFKELSINVIDNDKVIELLQTVKDLEIRAQIIDKINYSSTSQNHTTEEVPTIASDHQKVAFLANVPRKLLNSVTTSSVGPTG